MTRRNRLWIVVLASLVGSLTGRGAFAQEFPGAELLQPRTEEPGAIVLFPYADVLNKPGTDPHRPALLQLEETQPWDRLENPHGPTGNFLTKMEDSWVKVSSEVEVEDPAASSPRTLPGSKWKREDALQMAVTGPVYVFGQVGSTCDRVQTQDLKVVTKTGVACKWGGWQNCEVEVRGGPAMTCEDVVRQAGMKQQSELLLELEARYPLSSLVKLEYESSASPALTVADTAHLKQDLRLAIPLGSQGKLSVGAKHSWDSTTTIPPAQRSWTDGMELYLGLDLKR